MLSLNLSGHSSARGWDRGSFTVLRHLPKHLPSASHVALIFSALPAASANAFPDSACHELKGSGGNVLTGTGVAFCPKSHSAML